MDIVKIILTLCSLGVMPFAYSMERKYVLPKYIKQPQIFLPTKTRMIPITLPACAYHVAAADHRAISNNLSALASSASMRSIDSSKIQELSHFRSSLKSEPIAQQIETLEKLNLSLERGVKQLDLLEKKLKTMQASYADYRDMKCANELLREKIETGMRIFACTVKDKLDLCEDLTSKVDFAFELLTLRDQIAQRIVPKSMLESCDAIMYICLTDIAKSLEKLESCSDFSSKIACISMLNDLHTKIVSIPDIADLLHICTRAISFPLSSAAQDLDVIHIRSIQQTGDCTTEKLEKNVDAFMQHFDELPFEQKLATFTDLIALHNDHEAIIANMPYLADIKEKIGDFATATRLRQVIELHGMGIMVTEVKINRAITVLNTEMQTADKPYVRSQYVALMTKTIEELERQGASPQIIEKLQECKGLCKDVPARIVCDEQVAKNKEDFLKLCDTIPLEDLRAFSLAYDPNSPEYAVIASVIDKKYYVASRDDGHLQELSASLSEKQKHVPEQFSKEQIELRAATLGAMRHTVAEKLEQRQAQAQELQAYNVQLEKQYAHCKTPEMKIAFAFDLLAQHDKLVANNASKAMIDACDAMMRTSFIGAADATHHIFGKHPEFLKNSKVAQALGITDRDSVWRQIIGGNRTLRSCLSKLGQLQTLESYKEIRDLLQKTGLTFKAYTFDNKRYGPR